MISKVLFMSNKDDWETPKEFFDALNDRYHFTLDPCADEKNHKCKLYFTKEQNGLMQDWEGHHVYCNPPYGKEIGKWVEKCYEESRKPQTTCVMLIPARTDTKWFHEFIYGKSEIIFIKGRLKFAGAKNSAPFPSMIVIFENKENGGQ